MDAEVELRTRLELLADAAWDRLAAEAEVQAGTVPHALQLEALWKCISSSPTAAAVEQEEMAQPHKALSATPFVRDPSMRQRHLVLGWPPHLMEWVEAAAIGADFVPSH